VAAPPIARNATAGVSRPEPPILRLETDGRPLVSSSGFVQLADEGPGFYYGALVDGRITRSRRLGVIGTNN
jgi:hypothetical protein